MELSDFDYDLPRELIAQEPLDDRGGSRLMVLDGDRVRHRAFSDLSGFLRPDDVLVLNDSRVVPARLLGKRATGGKVELLVLGTRGPVAEALVRAKPLRPGERLSLGEGRCAVEERVAGARYRLRFEVPGGLARFLRRRGEMPTPPYIRRKLGRPERYQTVFARDAGSVAAPTAGLHFTPAMLDCMRASGVTVAFVTLHIGPATFQPVRARDVMDHRMEPEHYRIGGEAAAAVNGRRGRLVAVGTTVVKALESAARPDGTVPESEGWSDLFIRPGHEFRARPDALLTNFHLPRSTLIMLVSALVGRERLLAAYAEAVRERYRFYSFGDAMLCLL
ncbi:MAG: tRNA preQ1(34) S-adenosylmethionine ribosyltransferase-isomerase QueA [Euryarchaeota archaeon]|nr:tRNA preQ1(34) S-adenosylmethionine ribosyltransferase-isomerase QueA [Euryarchaeota archaeon]